MKIWQHKLFATALLLMLTWFLTACSQNDEQKEFEQKAFSEADGVTVTNYQGKVENEDPDDWRISPFYQGLIRIDPAFPNPAGSSDNIQIHIYNSNIESISDIEVRAYYRSTSEYRYLDHIQGELIQTLNILNFRGTAVAQAAESPQGTYRVIILDGNENVVSYGDIQIE